MFDHTHHHMQHHHMRHQQMQQAQQHMRQTQQGLQDQMFMHHENQRLFLEEADRQFQQHVQQQSWFSRLLDWLSR